MNCRMKRIAGITLAALSVMAAGVRAEDLVDNPVYKSWAAHGIGTKVYTDGTMAMAGMNITMEITTELVEKDAEKVVVETQSKMNMPGMPAQPPQKQKLTFKAKVPKGQEATGTLPPDVKGEVKELGNEKVDAGGKSYDCKVMEFKGTNANVEANGKVWTSPEIPGNTVKMNMTGTGNGQTMTMNLTLKSVEPK